MENACRYSQVNGSVLIELSAIEGMVAITVWNDGPPSAGIWKSRRTWRRTTKRRGGSAIDARTTRHAGYGVSQIKRKRIEESFGWLKTIALMRKVRHRGIFKVGWVFTFAAAAYNLVPMRNLGKPTVQSA